MDLLSAPPHSIDHPLPRRRNSISTPVVIGPLASHRAPSTTLLSDYLELLPIEPPCHSYSSLKDLLPSVAVNSPKKPKPSILGTEIRIRNRLVKQAAWAYLQPMSTALGSSDGNFFHRLWTRVACFIAGTLFGPSMDRSVVSGSGCVTDRNSGDLI